MIKSYPLILEGVVFGNHKIIGIYPFKDKVAIIHFAFEYTMQEEYDKEKRISSYVLLDTFSMDFNERQQAYLYYYEQETFSNNDATCYWDNNNFLLNTKRYTGFNKSIAKLIQISDTNLVEIEDAPAPTQFIYIDQRIYTFAEKEVYMCSHFMMECRDINSKNTIWKLKLNAYLYTEIEEQNGVLYFGTAGKGGHFYGVSIADGSVIFNYNTGGTVHFTWYNGKIIIANRKGKPVLLNPSDGSEIQKIEFGKFTITFDQIMLVIADSLYAVASCKNEMYAICANIKNSTPIS